MRRLWATRQTPFCGWGALGEDISNLVPDSILDLFLPAASVEELAIPQAPIQGNADSSTADAICLMSHLDGFDSLDGSDLTRAEFVGRYQVGRIAGFLGVMPRRMSMNGRPHRLAWKA